MGTNRTHKIEEALAHGAAEYLNRESNRGSLITVTRAILSHDNKRASIMISVLPEDKEESALWFLKRKRTDFQNYLRKHTRLPRLPLIDFVVDGGEKNRQRIDELSKE